MEYLRNKRRVARAATNPDELLEHHYDQLLKWGMVLTRGDAGVAQDIVHDLCLYFALAKPDLSQVANLDGYLYTSLKNIYLSMLSRASREAAQFVNVADFDSIYFALRTSDHEDLLQRQNDLRRICTYAVWRKDTAKSASYLILLFFHGYCRREVAAMARLPVAAIYNKLKLARAEVKSYLEEAGKLRIVRRDAPPQPELRLSPVSSAELFSELREKILAAKGSTCLPEEELLAHYAASNAKPIPCALLAHIVSCEQCLTLLDRHFQWPDLEDRQPPLDAPSMESSDKGKSGDAATNFRKMMRSVRRESTRIFEHRPQTLSISVNGKIVAFHDVQSGRSTLSSRIEQPEAARFIEVFAEQDIRLAFLNADERPPEGPSFRAQRVELSDDRWLELRLHFDGMGLQSEVTYHDPALEFAAAWTDDEEEFAAPGPNANVATETAAKEAVHAASPIRRALRFLRPLFAARRVAWSAALALALCVGGYFAYRTMRPLDAQQLLSRAIRSEQSAIGNNAEHRILSIAVAAADGSTLEQGTVDVWRASATGRRMRKLYNTQHQLIAAEWRDAKGHSGSYVGDALTKEDRELAESAAWQEDATAASFSNLAGENLQVRRVGENYELLRAQATDAEPGVVPAVLVLNRHLHPIGETLYAKLGRAVREVRLIETNYEIRKQSAVPDAVFEPGELDGRFQSEHGALSPQSALPQPQFPADARQVQAEIAALYELNRLGADVGEPIAITRTPDGHVRISGTVADAARNREIHAKLEALPERALFEIRITTAGELRAGRTANAHSANVYDFTRSTVPADAVLNPYFAAKGMQGNQLNAAVTQFAGDALGHGERALQHAYALQRLGESFNAAELQSAGLDAQREWAEMAAHHAQALEGELQALNKQLSPIASANMRTTLASPTRIQIENPGEFEHAASLLLREVQAMNRQLGESFASGTQVKGMKEPSALVTDCMQSIPLGSAKQMTAFAAQLAAVKNPAYGSNAAMDRR